MTDEENHRRPVGMVIPGTSENSRYEFSPEELDRLDKRWKSDVDLKLDTLVRFADEYRDFLKMLLVREKKRESFRTAVIEKTLTALIITGILGLLSLAWAGLSGEIKSITNSIKK